jgi:hypothetical protein
MTPEGKVKAKVSKLLAVYGEDVFYDMPVPGGYGKSTLDYMCCFHGRFFAVETKAPNKEPTERQEIMLRRVRHAGGRTFVVAGDVGLEDLKLWLASVHLSATIEGVTEAPRE